MRFYYCIFFTWLAKPSQEESYSSVDRLESLLREEKQLLPQLKTIVDNLEFIRQKITKYLIEASSLLPENPGDVVKDPLVGFQLIRRMGHDLPAIPNLLSLKFTNETNFTLPKPMEINKAAKSLVNLQFFYKLNATELANGKIGHRQSYTKLTANDCLLIAEKVNDSFDNDDILNWVNAAKNLWHRDKTNVDDFQQKILRLQGTMEKTEKQRTKECNSRGHFLNITLWDGVNISNSDCLNFNLLCRGFKLLPPQYETDLKCLLSNRGELYFILMPIKMEVVSKYPVIILFHDVVSDNEIENLKNLSRPLMERSVVGRQSSNGSLIFDMRISQTAWLYTDDPEESFPLSLRISCLTELICEIDDVDCEPLQVVNYGIGGEFSLHRDVYQRISTDNILTDTTHEGRRLATIMFYFNDVELGGFTAFPRAGVFVKPQKGSAVFWYNIFPDGSDDVLTMHGGCPVLYGSKWIATKWIFEKSQMFVRPCPLKKEKTAKKTIIRRRMNLC